MTIDHPNFNAGLLHGVWALVLAPSPSPEDEDAFPAIKSGIGLPRGRETKGPDLIYIILGAYARELGSPDHQGPCPRMTAETAAFPPNLATAKCTHTNALEHRGVWLRMRARGKKARKMWKKSSVARLGGFPRPRRGSAAGFGKAKEVGREKKRKR